MQPDLLFVAADRVSIIGEKFISAAPDLVVEVLSPSTEDRDRTLKMKLYARAGVRELWCRYEGKENRGPHQSADGFRQEAAFGLGATSFIPSPGLQIPIVEA